MLALIGAAYASPIIEMVVLSPKSQSAHEVADGGPIEAKSKIRLLISTDKSGELTVEFNAVGRPTLRVVDKQLISGSGNISLPSKEGWYELDGAVGKGSFTVSLISGGQSDVESFEFFQVPSIIDKPEGLYPLGESIDGPKKPVKAEVVAASDKQTIENATLAFPVVDRLLNSKSVALRGAAGAKIFRTFSKSVVLIVTKDGIGSGALINEKGHIITNWHVIKGHRNVAVVIKPEIGEKVKKSDVLVGEVIRVDEISDLALVKISVTPRDIMPIPMGKLEKLEVGSDVHAIGHPTGENWTYTQGIVSQVRASYKWQTVGDVEHEATVIQTQTPINPGSSGGPLFNDEGELIGINSFVRKNADGLNYAVSVKDVGSFLQRRHDRITKKVPAVKGDCEPISKELDENKNGIPEKILMDTDCDGKIDAIGIDEDEDWILEKILQDTDGDGKIDTVVIRSKPDGPFDVWLLDKDGDNKPDVAGVDTDGDGKPDKFRKLS